MLDTSGLPHRIASLDQAGLDRMLDWAREDPSRPERLADLLEQDPVALVDHLFRLTDGMRRAMSVTGPDGLRERLGPVIAALHTGQLGPMTIEFPPVAAAPDAVRGSGCNCLVNTKPPPAAS